MAPFTSSPFAFGTGGSILIGQTLVNGATTYTPWMLNLADAITPGLGFPPEQLCDTGRGTRA